MLRAIRGAVYSMKVMEVLEMKEGDGGVMELMEV